MLKLILRWAFNQTTTICTCYEAFFLVNFPLGVGRMGLSLSRHLIIMHHYLVSGLFPQFLQLLFLLSHIISSLKRLESSILLLLYLFIKRLSDWGFLKIVIILEERRTGKLLILDTRGVET